MEYHAQFRPILNFLIERAGEIPGGRPPRHYLDDWSRLMILYAMAILLSLILGDLLSKLLELFLRPHS